MSDYINTDEKSELYRAKTVDISKQLIRIADLRGTTQENDLTLPPNCGGFGRIRHFRRMTSPGWPSDPLPMDPACKALGLPRVDSLKAQVFQIAACNWRCWYCFVPTDLLSANPNHSQLVSASTLVDMYLAQCDPPIVIDLSGGHPDLVPEWVPWMMKEFISRGIENKVYLWSDNNLSTNYYWDLVSKSDQELVATYPSYGRACCFKGFSAETFSFNTGADPSLFGRQFEQMAKFASSGLDLYGYVTLTAPPSINIADEMRSFVERLQSIDENLPLRTVPLEIKVFTPMKQRIAGGTYDEALKNQQYAIEAWQSEIDKRFTAEERNRNIADVPLKRKNL